MSNVTIKKPIGLGRKCSNCQSTETQIYITKKGYPHAKWIKDGKDGWYCHNCYTNIFYRKGKRAPSNPDNILRRDAIRKHNGVTVCFLCKSTETYKPENSKYGQWYLYHDNHICAKCYWKQRRRDSGEFKDFKNKLNQRICSNCKSNKTQTTITKRGYQHKKWIKDGKGGWLCHNCSKKILYRNQERICKRRQLLRNPRFHWSQMSLRNHKRAGYEIDINMFEDIVPMAMAAEKCNICDIPLTWGYLNGKPLKTTPSLDRINNEKVIRKDNIQIICFECNMTKRTKPMNEFIAYCKYVAKKYQ